MSHDLNRYDDMQRLEQFRGPEYIDPCVYCEHESLQRSGNPIAAVVLIVIGVAIGLVLMSVVHVFGRPAPVRFTCQTCHNSTTHQPAKLDTYRKYRAFHKNHAGDSSLLAELVRP